MLDHSFNEVIELHLDWNLLGLLEYLPTGQSRSSFLSSVGTRDLAFKGFFLFLYFVYPKTMHLSRRTYSSAVLKTEGELHLQHAFYINAVNG